MTSKLIIPMKRTPRSKIKPPQENSDKNSKVTEQKQTKTFITWYKHMVDEERQNLGLYLADDASLEWFGRTIKSRKKVSAFLKHDMQCSKHYFTSVEKIEKIQSRLDFTRKPDNAQNSPVHSPIKAKVETSDKKCLSPEWAEGCQPIEGVKPTRRKKSSCCLFDHVDSNSNDLKRSHPDELNCDIGHNGDGIGQKIKRKCVPVTPPNLEVGQGDCLPSTSGTDSDKSHDALNSQLPKLAIECNGYIEFTRSRNSRSSDSVKWERKFKVQISYSEDPLNIGEYIIWALRYTDESKCRRNLLAEFEEIARNEGLKSK